MIKLFNSIKKALPNGIADSDIFELENIRIPSHYDAHIKNFNSYELKFLIENQYEVLQASVAELPFQAETFDLVTSFETIYFWPGLVDCFREVYRVTKPGGTFFICNESNGETNKDDKWVEKIGGMTIYNASQILTALNQAGFTDAKAHKNSKGWICVTARKGL